MLLLLSADLFQDLIKKKTCRNNYRVSKSLDSDHDRHSVGPDLDPNYLQRLLAEDKSRC